MFQVSLVVDISHRLQVIVMLVRIADLQLTLKSPDGSTKSENGSLAT